MHIHAWNKSFILADAEELPAIFFALADAHKILQKLPILQLEGKFANELVKKNVSANAAADAVPHEGESAGLLRRVRDVRLVRRDALRRHERFLIVVAKLQIRKNNKLANVALLQPMAKLSNVSQENRCPQNKYQTWSQR